MLLHENEEDFLDIIAATSEKLGVSEEQVEKDYYVSYMLGHLVKEIPHMVFKGGTSLSKCYGVIKRFSEDIDIHYATNQKPTQGERKRFKEAIVRAIDNANLDLINADQIRSKRDHNNYEVAFPQVTESSTSLKKEILIETYVPIKTFPTERKHVSSFIFDYLQKEKEGNIIKQFELAPFEINVQNIERTFIDKIFAVCDYYEQQKFDRHSRHLYDLHKILMTNRFDITKVQLLYEEVRKERKQKPEINISSGDNYNVVNTLEKIIRKDLYKEDYQNVTESLLFENVPMKT